MLCSVTEDSSLGGGGGVVGASAGFSAGLASFSCAGAAAAIETMDKTSASGAHRFFKPVIFLSSEQTAIGWFDKTEIVHVVTLLDYFVRRLICRNSSPFLRGSTKSPVQSSVIQSAPACRSSESLAVVRRASTRAPAALPARIPAGASSITRQSDAGTPRNCAPLR